MSLYLALSCLQGRPAAQAFDALVALGPDGIQLTPGNTSFEGFADHVRASGVPVAIHHSFSWTQRRAVPWANDGLLCNCEPGATVHPPMGNRDNWLERWMRSSDFKLHQKHYGTRVLETMYPSAEGYHLADERGLDEAMGARLPLAIDVSHVFIQRCAGMISEDGIKRLFGYDHIAEIHVSANHGHHDTHERLTPDSFGLAWARERMGDARVVLECFMHRLSEAERREQLAIVRGSL